MKKLTLAALALVLTGCNTPNHIEGNLTLGQKLNVNALTAVFNQPKKITLDAATYKTSLYMKQEGAEVRIQTRDGVYHFNVPQITADALGNFNVPANKLGQEFSFQGKLFNSRDDIDRTVHDRCVHHYDQDYQCRDEQHCVRDNAGNQTCGTEHVCEWVQVPVYGSEPVHETGYQDTKNVQVSLVKAGRAAGRFNGSYTYSENIQSRQVIGGCTL